MRTIVFDIETQREFAEVGGAHNRHLLGVAVIGCYDSATDAFTAYVESEVLTFGKVLKQADCIVGFNSNYFDFPVIQPYLPFDTAKLPSLDLMADLERMLGHRVSLDSCATATLGTKKSGDGLQAIQWYRQGKLDLVKKYCLDDVRITRDLYEYGKSHGEISFLGKDGGKRTIPVAWGGGAVDTTGLRRTLEDAHRSGRRVDITYVTTRPDTKVHEQNRRKIDIIAIRGDAVDAFCHLRQDTRRFLLDRISDVTVLAESTNPGLAVGQHALL